jgi:hypothetical protein
VLTRIDGLIIGRELLRCMSPNLARSRSAIKSSSCRLFVAERPPIHARMHRCS